MRITKSTQALIPATLLALCFIPTSPVIADTGSDVAAYTRDINRVLDNMSSSFTNPEHPSLSLSVHRSDEAMDFDTYFADKPSGHVLVLPTDRRVVVNPDGSSAHFVSTITNQGFAFTGGEQAFRLCPKSKNVCYERSPERIEQSQWREVPRDKTSMKSLWRQAREALLAIPKAVGRGALGASPRVETFFTGSDISTGSGGGNLHTWRTPDSDSADAIQSFQWRNYTHKHRVPINELTVRNDYTPSMPKPSIERYRLTAEYLYLVKAPKRRDL